MRQGKYRIEVGDLVRAKSDRIRNSKVYLVHARNGAWIKVIGDTDWLQGWNYEVVNASG